MKRPTLAACAFLLVWASFARAETYYVAVDGKATGDGSKDRPWLSVQEALGKVGGGHTVLVRPGIHGPIKIAASYSGTRERPTVVRSEVKWKAKVIGGEDHGITLGDRSEWVVIDGFDITCGGYDGIRGGGKNHVVRNCWIHHNGSMGMLGPGSGSVIENNLVEFNGTHVQFQHGVYTSGEGLTIRNNVVRHNASYGLHFYPKIKNSLIANNLVYGQVRSRGIIVATDKGGGNNRVINNTVVERSPLEMWNPGNGDVVANNILVAQGGGPAISYSDPGDNLRVDYNLCVPKFDHQGPGGITGDPQFVNTEAGAFWLRAESPALGKGSPELATPSDFWGRSRTKGEKIDLGAFPFEPVLAKKRTWQDWHPIAYGAWLYAHHENKNRRLPPDFWALAVLTK